MAEPKYLQIENELKDEIVSGQFQYGDKFYSEKELKERFNVSSITVIRSVKELVKAGYLVRYQGKGTFVSHSPNQRLVQYKALNVFDNTDQASEDIKVLGLEKQSDSDINFELGLTKDDIYYKLTQLRSVNGEAFLYYQAFFPTNLINKETADDADNLKNIFLSIEKDANIYLLDEPFREELSVVAAPAVIAEKLNLQKGDFVVKQVRKILSAKQNQVLLYMINYKRVDYAAISFETPDYPAL